MRGFAGILRAPIFGADDPILANYVISSPKKSFTALPFGAARLLYDFVAFRMPCAFIHSAQRCGQVEQASALGLKVDGPSARISFDYPLLPESLPEMQILNLRVGTATVDLLLRRSGHDVGVNVLRREGKVEIVTVK